MIYLLVGGWPTETFSIHIPTSKSRLQPDAILLLTRKIDLPLFPMWIHAEANGTAVYQLAALERLRRCLADEANVVVRVSGASASAPMSVGRAELQLPKSCRH